MRLLILLCDKDSMLRKIKNYIAEDYTLLECEMAPKTLLFLNNVISGVVLVDMTAAGAANWIKEIHSHRPDLTCLGLFAAQDNPDDSLLPFFYYFIRAPFSRRQVNMQLARAWERIELQLELQNREKSTSDSVTKQKILYSPSPTPDKDHILREFSKALSNNFNRDRLLELFMDTVESLVPVGKLSIMLYDEEQQCYRVVFQRGLDPHFASGLRFKTSAGLISWLASEGCILSVGEISAAPPGISVTETLQEMKLLQAAVCIPLLAYGQLVGLLNMGPKITGSSFYEEELEIFYFLCGNLAIALRDIAFYHQVRDQNTYIESILQRMNSGVVAINGKERIITFNSRAGELLALSPPEVMGKDLRILPSPLGDLLYEASITGKSLLKEEIELLPGKTPLEITTYQLLNMAEESLGGVMIFDDITPRKQLEAERRQADQLDVLNKFVGQLAHEVKNPMVAIQTFAELLTEKYDDRSFRDFFTRTVRQEVKRLNELVEQLIAFSTPLSYKYDVINLHEILAMGLSLLQEQGMGRETTVETAYADKALNIKADKTLLARAFSYLLRDSFRAVEAGGTLYIQTFFSDNGPTGAACIRLGDDQTKTSAKNVQKMFEPLAAQQNGYISLGLPVSRKIIEDHGGLLKAGLAGNKSLLIEITLPIFP